MGRESYAVAGGIWIECAIYRLYMEWGGVIRPVEALALEGNSLLGAMLLEGHSLYIEMTPGGETTAPQVLKECEKLLRRAADEFGDVKLASGGTVGDKVQVELDDILHLAVGKVAPDIEGEDQDGKKFKLSDYRGKVVLLDFWHQY